jgi:hypothetical protein
MSWALSPGRYEATQGPEDVNDTVVCATEVSPRDTENLPQPKDEESDQWINTALM